jgi:anthranilate synthase component 1
VADKKAIITHLNDHSKDDIVDVDIWGSLRLLHARTRMTLPEHLPSMAAGLFGYLGYDMVRYCESLPEILPKTLRFDDAVMMRPLNVVMFDSVADTITITALIIPSDAAPADPNFPSPKKEDEASMAYDKALSSIHEIIDQLQAPLEPDSHIIAPPPIAAPKAISNCTSSEFKKMVTKAKEYITAGDIFQAVLSQRFSCEFDEKPMTLYRRLRSLNPSPFSFLLTLGEVSLVGSSPEILVRVKDNVMTVRPIAGTRPRGATPDEDLEHAQSLMEDEKELAEHLMLLDLGRNDVGRVARPSSVKVVDKMTLEYYSHVMHITSTVEGMLADDKDAIDALIAGFPAGTVSGAPKIRAMEIIEELEKDRRGVYAGAVGYLSVNGDIETCIALRTGVVHNNMLHVQAGGGVVADSSPEGEYQESRNKAKAVLSAAGAAF